MEPAHLTGDLDGDLDGDIPLPRAAARPRRFSPLVVRGASAPACSHSTPSSTVEGILRGGGRNMAPVMAGGIV
jgi:hypothetical protein